MGDLLLSTKLNHLDFGKIASGLKKIFVEGLPKAISALGTAFFSAVEGLLTFLGVGYLVYISR